MVSCPYESRLPMSTLRGTRSDYRMYGNTTGTYDFSSPPWKQEGTPMAEIAKRFASQRHQRHLSMTEVAHLMGINERVILEIEYGNPNREATLSDYMQYADTLSSSLKEIFAAHLSQE